jgi:subtilisin family serine protease
VQHFKAPEDKRVDHSYIMVFNKNITDATIAAYTAKLKSSSGVVIQHEYSFGDFRGLSVFMSDDALALRLEEDSMLEYIDEDQKVTLEKVEESQQQCGSQSTTAWNLARLSQYTPDVGLTPYTYPATGAGVNSYIIDTGIRTTHQDFGGRAFWGYPTGGSDCNGHGTHVASTVGGTTWGVAKEVLLYAVKVLDCSGGGTISGIIAGINWVTNHAASRKPANANMSLGGGLNTAFNQAVTSSINSGISYIVAAGNSNANACSFSPASATGVICVGATSTAPSGNTEYDIRASFSNWGTCCHIFAPGQDVTAAWHTSNTALSTISGTSMASPHVAGVVSLYQQLNPSASPNALRQSIVNSASDDLIDMRCTSAACNNSPNLLLHSSC